MARLIDADALIARQEEICKDRDTEELDRFAALCVAAAVKEAPTAERRGCWMPDKKFDTYVLAGNTICSECGKGAFDQPNYCPHCGAKMEGSL